MPTEFSEPNSYICLFPSIGLKECGKFEHDLKTIYEKYPDIDYYTQHAASVANRGVPGEYKIFLAKPAQQQPGILNMYVKVYPGTKAYPNDNSFLRLKNFANIFKNLATVQGINSLHLDIPTNVPSERQEYLICLEDYITTSKLHGNTPTIFIHGAAIQSKEQVVGRVKAKIMISAKTPDTVLAPTTRAEPVYKLVYDDSQLNTTTLYEVDVVQIKSSNPSVQNGVLLYFPDGWEKLTSDTKLIQEAIEVERKLKGILGNEDVFPPSCDIFNAFAFLREQPKVIILGQDPYHGPGQAHGLSFSVREGVSVPPSLRNVYTALENDDKVEFKRPKHGCLTKWAEQGVIMLNSSLTVEQKKPKSHLAIWTPFTDRLIQLLSTKYTDLVFVLWGGDAKKKSSLISGNSHEILEFNHPSPALPNNTFRTHCKHFGQINDFLTKKGKKPIDWNL